jgi:hypothetical protein
MSQCLKKNLNGRNVNCSSLLSSLTIMAVLCSRATFLQELQDVVFCGVKKGIVRLQRKQSIIVALYSLWCVGRSSCRNFWMLGEWDAYFWGIHVRPQTAYRVTQDRGGSDGSPNIVLTEADLVLGSQQRKYLFQTPNTFSHNTKVSHKNIVRNLIQVLCRFDACKT